MNKIWIKWVIFFPKMKLTAIMMWIGTLAIIGFPYSSGYFSKDLILSSSFNLISMGPVIYIILAIVSAMTAFYSFRLIFKVFHGKYKGDYDYDKIHESGPFMLTPLIILSIGAIFAGYYFNELLAGYNAANFWNDVIYLGYEKNKYSSFFPILSKSLVAVGVIFAVYFYGYNLERLVSLKLQFKNLYQFILNKWYFDELYNKIFVGPIYNLGNFLWNRVDQGFIDKFLPNGSASIVAIIAKKAKKFNQVLFLTTHSLLSLVLLYLSVSFSMFRYLN